MKHIATPLLAIAIASTLAGCTSPDDASPVEQPSTPTKSAPSIEQPAAEQPSTNVAESIPALHALDETERAQPLAPANNCNLESVDGILFAGADITLAIPAKAKATGWLRADHAGAVIDKPTLRIEAADKMQLWDVPVLTTIVRDDVPLNAAKAATPGFEVVFDAGALPSGRYHLYLAYSVDGTLTGCDNGRYITIL